ncbi:MAG: PIN domain-containing protein [Candidatus Daviesbacteria bacterium]|nr:PIN domain-containing protein [Candidatus Daviesbacteria bacterium]
MYLIDTNVLILALKSIEPDKSFLKKIISQKKLNLSVISVGEFFSQATQEAEDKLNSLIAKFPVLAVDLEVAKVAAEYRKKFLKQKRGQLLDYFLAAQAKIHGLILITNNKTDFPMKDIKVISPK